MKSVVKIHSLIQQLGQAKVPKGIGFLEIHRLKTIPLTLVISFSKFKTAGTHVKSHAKMESDTHAYQITNLKTVQLSLI